MVGQMFRRAQVKPKSPTLRYRLLPRTSVYNRTFTRQSSSATSSFSSASSSISSPSSPSSSSEISEL